MREPHKKRHYEYTSLAREVARDVMQTVERCNAFERTLVAIAESGDQRAIDVLAEHEVGKWARRLGAVQDSTDAPAR